jgi:hypothetical protein
VAALHMGITNVIKVLHTYGQNTKQVNPVIGENVVIKVFELFEIFICEIPPKEEIE